MSRLMLGAICGLGFEVRGPALRGFRPVEQNAVRPSMQPAVAA